MPGDEDVRRFGFHIPTVARVHGVTVTVTIAIALVVLWRVRRHADERAALTPALTTWLFVAALQATIGYVQYFNGVPELLVGLHVAGATALVVVTTQVVLDTRRPVAGPSRSRATLSDVLVETRRLTVDREPSGMTVHVAGIGEPPGRGRAS